MERDEEGWDSSLPIWKIEEGRGRRRGVVVVEWFGVEWSEEKRREAGSGCFDE